METPRAWSAYAATVRVLDNRRQSLAFMAGVGLKPQPLVAPKKWVDKQPRDLGDWDYIDTFQNYGCPLVGDFLDIDVDCRPKGDHEDYRLYTTAFYATAIAVMQTVQAALETAGLRFRAFGRASYGGKGHFIVECPVAPKEEELLRRLHMRRAIEVDGIMVRIEVRRRAEKKEAAKVWTLPGSVYERQDKQGYDLIEWSPLAIFAEGSIMPRLDPQPYEKLRLGLYIALMGLALLPHWESGARHDCAFHLAGALAHEWREGTFTEDECIAVMRFMLEQSGDTEEKDRFACLADAIQAIASGRKVTGYTRLAELFIGDDWKKAILTLRGGGDPDAVGALFDIVARVHKGADKANTYVDLSAGPSLYVEMNAEGLRHRFRNNRKYPPVPNAKGKLIPAIEIVMASEHILTFDATVAFPGIEFGVRYTLEDGVFHEIEGEGMPLDVPVYLNIAAGFATLPYAEGEAPDPADYAEAKRLWFQLREHLTGDAKEAAQLDQVIAHKLQRVREKHPVGLAMVGGYQIGKSFLWEIVMKRLIGDLLVRTSSIADLQDEKRFNGIDRCLFYVFEECRMDKLSGQEQQLVKDIMRNPTTHINRKYGGIGAVPNRCVPIFLSNEHNPQLIFDGIPDRALVVIHGDSQEALGFNKAEWKAHQDLIHEETSVFAKALDRREFRRALLHYFLEGVPWNVELVTSYNEGGAASEDLERGLPAGLQAIVSIIREGYLMPLRKAAERGPSITEPFALETLGLAVRERLRDRTLRYDQRYTDNGSIGNLIAALFMTNTRKSGVRKSKGKDRADREHLVLHFVRHKGMRMYYFRWRRGELLAQLEALRGLKLDTEYVLEADGERGDAPVPTLEAVAKSYDFATKQQDRTSSYAYNLGIM